MTVTPQKIDIWAMEIDAISRSAEMLGELMQTAAKESTELASDLIAVGAEQMVDINQLETIGNVVDIYV